MTLNHDNVGSNPIRSTKIFVAYNFSSTAGYGWGNCETYVDITSLDVIKMIEDELARKNSVELPNGKFTVISWQKFE